MDFSAFFSISALLFHIYIYIYIYMICINPYYHRIMKEKQEALVKQKRIRERTLR